MYSKSTKAHDDSDYVTAGRKCVQISDKSGCSETRLQDVHAR